MAESQRKRRTKGSRGYSERGRQERDERLEPRRGYYAAQVFGTQPDFRGKGPKGFQRADARIHEDVCEQLTEDPEVDASEIAVHVEQGEVALSGSVTDRRQKRRAEDVALEVMGVRDVHNRLTIGTPPSSLEGAPPGTLEPPSYSGTHG